MAARALTRHETGDWEPMADRLFWVVREHNGERSVFIRRASTEMFAALHAGLAGQEGEYIEAIELNEKAAARIPVSAIGRVLNERIARALIYIIGGA